MPTTTKKTLFKRIIDRELPADVIYEDELCIAIRDINPQTPTHILVIPKKEIPSLDDCQDEDAPLLGHLMATARNIAVQLNLGSGYRLVMNCGQDGGQTVDHLHLHLLGGRKLAWPPG
jgi:histidine triad (HIT) family protein